MIRRFQPSIYDLLQLPEYQIRKLDTAVTPSFRFDTSFLLVERAWLICGSGESHTLMAETPPTQCDYTYDNRLRCQDGHYLPISRIQTDGHSKLEPLPRVQQLLEQHLQVLLPDDEELLHVERRIVLQAPPSVEPQALLDSLLASWPLDKQPKTGLEVTALAFDEWLASALEQQEAKTDSLQFIAIEPLCIEERGQRDGPHGEMLVSLWLRRAPEVKGPDAPSANLKLYPPQYVSHAPRSGFSRRQPSPLDEMMAHLKEGMPLERMAGVVWDGDSSGSRSDHFIDAVQTHLAHLYFDTDVWSVRTLAGALQSVGPAAQAVMAYQLAQQRENDILILNTQDETQTWAIHAQYAQSAMESNGAKDEQLQP
ncbi:hypothetical protein [Halomonas binhaiensis]|uniref:Uncharacterized protein n=1 Tax=Halomonas binhaiensis TaxID=2562282 RepID=A0A5C1NH47_9GAMM|nr:hypothetical protein [Halomonas binhaiensis]QEM82544.1 hypothetical protein E4T21_14055 [Halomonas binhaiensis]